QWLRAERRSWTAVLAVLRQAGEGLAAAHAAGLVHRDFKPENVLVGEDGRPRVSDFGLARADTRAAESIPPDAKTSPLDTPMTVTGSLMGTPAYMAPELLEDGVADARSDQFAFCVVAWECLFGARPFTGSTLAALALATERQELRRPANTEVPPRVRGVIERGLRFDPTTRHDDMPALLTALREASMPRTRRRVAIGAGAIVVVVGSAIAIAAPWSGGGEAPCAIGDSALAGVWDSGVRDKIRAAFAATGVHDSLQLAQRAEAVIDDYSRAWIAMRRGACEATRVRGEQSEALLDLRMECLDRKRDELRALAYGLAEADRPAAMGSVRATLGLTPIARCADVTALAAPIRPPLQPIRDRVEAERSELATVRALRLLGRIRPALDKTEAIAARAKQLGYRPLDAEVLLVLGDLKDRSGDTASGIKLIEEAVAAAEAGNHKLVAAEAWSNLAWMLGYEDRQFERAEFAVRLAGAAIENLGGNAELSAQLTNYEALILETKGQLGPAKTKYLAALAERERMNQHDSWQISLV
ncbi:MAG TPA: protein kinase, partial [Kofleriaceae bacterium]|nr:protein kinase [Kofleriaceae bacterium]